MDYVTQISIMHRLRLLATIVIIFYFISWAVSNKFKNFKGVEPYECGYQPQDYDRKNINIKFFILSIRFLIFDLEIVRLLPRVRSLKFLSRKGRISLLYFYCIINAGFVNEWCKDAIKL